MTYLKRQKTYIFFLIFLCASYNLYFIFLVPNADCAYLAYLNLLLFVCMLTYTGIDYFRWKKVKNQKEELLKSNGLIYREFLGLEHYEIAEHDVSILTEQLREQMELNSDLQDYIAKWCHEVKIPLSACLLMNEKIEDGSLRVAMKEQLERINTRLKDALLGCKIQSSLFDIQIKRVSLTDCVKTSVKNHQFFLIRNRFRLELQVEDCMIYTDKNWFVYILDQLIGNAVKYSAEDPVLKIWSKRSETSLVLLVEDHGEGIQACDIRRIFEKGYTGSSHHNGKYKSTGMGLYMTARIVEKLGYRISAESEEGSYTRFRIEIPETL